MPMVYCRFSLSRSIGEFVTPDPSDWPNGQVILQRMGGVYASVKVSAMNENLIFMMGEFEAEFPPGLMYAANHMWALPLGETLRFGFTAYAVRLLQDVYFMDWLVESPADLTSGQEIGSIESKKAESSLYAPVTGRLSQFNDELLDDPSAVNTDKYGQGWLFEVSATSPDLLSADQYVELLSSVWAKTQQTIKGQLNE